MARESKHPHSHGEYSAAVVVFALPPGSSPLSRGILRRRFYSISTVGIIPALAGNTSISGTEAENPQDHPRSRGEYQSPSHTRHQVEGSSPLSRGIPLYGLVTHMPSRIIPALAGNTRVVSVSASKDTDHPRSRGEYKDDYATVEKDLGSSPLSRGIPPARTCNVER